MNNETASVRSDSRIGSQINRPTVIVCGFGRCGTSLVMRMLHKGGMSVFADNTASYEQNEFMRYPVAVSEVAVMFAGKAVKLLEPQLWKWHKNDFRVIWLDRYPVEQAKSQIKLLRMMSGMRIPNGYELALADSIEKDTEPTIKLLNDNCGAVKRFRFEDIVNLPYIAAKEISDFVGGLDVLAMSKCVIARPASCRPNLDIEMAAVQRREDVS